LREIPNAWFESIQQKAIRGTPDLLGCVGQYFVALEVKASKGKATVLQEYKLEQIRKCGARAVVVSPENIDDVLVMLNALSKAQGEIKDGKRS
jgi:Holliday junction resolvase